MQISPEKLGIFFSGSLPEWVLPWITGFMVYIACLITALGVLTHSRSNQWDQSFEGKLSVIIAPQKDAETTKRAAENVTNILISQNKNIQSASVLEEAPLRDLLRPWLGSGAAVQGLNLPALITLEITDMSDRNLDALRHDIKIIMPDAQLDDHALIRGHIKRFSKLLQITSFLLVTLVIISNAAIVIVSVNNVITSYHKTIEALHLVGATDKNIIRGFTHAVFFLALRGCFLGTLSAVITMFSLIFFTNHIENTFIKAFHLSLTHWGLILCVPAFMLAIIMLCTQKTIHWQLEKMV